MLRSFRLNPQIFLEILYSGGCKLGRSNELLQYVTNPLMSGRSTVVRLDQEVTEIEIEAHLYNLAIEEADFLEWHERFTALLKN